MPKHSSHKLRCKPDAFGPRTGTPAVRAMIMISAALCLLTAPGLCARASTGGQVPDGLETDRAVTLSLYFADPARFALLAEQRQLPRPENPLALGRAIIGELVAGPDNKHLVRTLPDGAILRALFIDADKTAYVDLDNTMWARHPGSVQSDILAVYSIVNSLVLNMAEIDTVKILSRGREPIPAAGHLDLRYPFKANILLIR